MKTMLSALALVAAAGAAMAETPIPQGFLDAGLTNVQPVFGADGTTVLYWTATNDTPLMTANGQTLDAASMVVGAAYTGELSLTIGELRDAIAREDARRAAEEAAQP